MTDFKGHVAKTTSFSPVSAGALPIRRATETWRRRCKCAVRGSSLRTAGGGSEIHAAMGSGLLQRQAAARGRQLADGQHARPARGITTALAALQDETGLASETRQIKSLNHRVKQDHRLIQRILQSLLGFSALASARCTVRV